jgi:hypothetical protein
VQGAPRPFATSFYLVQHEINGKHQVVLVLLHNSVIPPVIAGLATLSTEDSVELCGGARARGLYEETQIDVGKMIWTTEVY